MPNRQLAYHPVMSASQGHQTALLALDTARGGGFLLVAVLIPRRHPLIRYPIR